MAIRSTGDIIAENYIISSSVTYMTQSFASGSTVFGNSNDDTHTFTGSLFITGSRIDLNDGSNNVSVGKDAGKAITTGADNIVIGSGAGVLMTDNNYNTVIGKGAFAAANTGENSNVVIGRQAGSAIDNSSADNNVIIGSNAGTGGGADMSLCVVIGNEAMNSTAANAQEGTIAIGADALTALTSGTENTAVGYNAGLAMTTSAGNTIMGYAAGDALVEGANYNTAIGAHSLGAGNNDATHANVCIGYASGNSITLGHSNVTIGYEAQPSAVGGANQIVIGYDATGVADNSVVLGNANVTAVYMSYDSGATVHCAAVTEGSSLEIKKNISEIESPLDKITKLRGIEFDYKENNKHSIGMIAEEVNEIFPELVSKDEDGKVTAMSYSRMTAVLLEAVKELSQEVKELKMSNNYNSKEGE